MAGNDIGRSFAVAAAMAAAIGAPGAGATDANLQLNDPMGNAALTSLSDSDEALSSIAEGYKEQEEIADKTDVSQEATSSLMIDPAELGALAAVEGVEFVYETDPTEGDEVELFYETDLSVGDETETVWDGDSADVEVVDISWETDDSDAESDLADTDSDVGSGLF